MCLIQDTRQNHDWLMRVFPPDTRFHAVIIRYELSYWSLSSLFSLDRSMTDCRKSSLLTLASMLSSSGTSYPIGHLVLITHWIYPWLTVASFPSWHSLPCCHLQVLATLLHGHLVLVSHWTECESVPSGYSDTRSCSLIGSFQRSLL